MDAQIISKFQASNPKKYPNLNDQIPKTIAEKCCVSVIWSFEN
jgi:hypothetical protein